MIIYDAFKYETYIDDNIIKKIERDLKVKCLFGGAFSTCVYDINNSVSDFDFYIIFDKEDTNLNTYRYFNEKSLSDIVMLDLQYIIRSNKKYFASINKYPSMFYRQLSEEVPLFNLHRTDFTTQIIFEILYSDYLWDSGYLKYNINNILKDISVIGVMDYYFSRAYGNLKNNLSKSQIHTQKYLMTFLGLACIKWLVETNTIPNMKFTFMYEKYCPKQFREFLLKVYQKQRNVNNPRDYKFHSFNVGTHNLFEVQTKVLNESKPLKRKPIAYIDRNKHFNDWLEVELLELSRIMKDISINKQINTLKLGDVAYASSYFE